MRSFFTKLDLLGAQPCLYISSQPRYQSIFGFFLTTVIFSLILASGLYFFIVFVNGDEVYLIYSKDTKAFDPYVDMTNRILFYQVADYEGVLVDPRLVITVPTLWYIDNEKSDVEVLEEVNCSSENLYNKEEKTLINFDISNYKCLKRKGDKKLELSITHSPFTNTYMNLYITMCQNTTENGNHCYPKSVIEEKINDLNLYLNFYLESTSLDHHNQKKPMSTSFFADQVSVSPDFIYCYFYDWRSLFYESDEGIMFPSIKTINGFEVDSTTKRNELYPKGAEFWAPDSLSIFQFGMNAGFAEKYQRSYPKFQTFLANFGGVCNALMKIGECIAYFTSNQMMFSTILGHLSMIKPKKESVVNNNINTSEIICGNNKFEKNGVTSMQFNSLTNIIISKKQDNKPTMVDSSKERPHINSCDSILGNLLPARQTKKASFMRLFERSFKEKLSCEYIFQIFSAVDCTDMFSKDRTIFNMIHRSSFDDKKKSLVDIKFSKLKRAVKVSTPMNKTECEKSEDISNLAIKH